MGLWYPVPSRQMLAATIDAVVVCIAGRHRPPRLGRAKRSPCAARGMTKPMCTFAFCSKPSHADSRIKGDPMRALLTLILTSCGPSFEHGSDDDERGLQDAQDVPEMESGTDGVDDASTQDCDSELGTVTGRVLYDLEQLGQTSVAPYANVTATPPDGENITIRSDAEGAFTALLPADEYLLMANDTDACVSDQASVQLESCGTVSMTLRLTECLDGLDADGAE